MGLNNIEGVSKRNQYGRHRKKYSDEELINLITNLAENLERTPTIRDFNNKYDNPHPSIIRDRFGSWNEGIKKAGIEPNKPHDINEKPDDVKLPEDKKWEGLSYYQRWYYKNTDKERQRTFKQRKQKKEWFRNYKKQLKCENGECNEDHIATLVFHHTDKKDMDISKMVNNNHSKESIFEEIKKCTVLCANCHRKEHYNN